MNKPESTSSSKIMKVLLWLLSFLLSAFFIVSALGWFAALQMMHAGKLGQKATDFAHSLTVIDEVVRIAQVVVIIVAAVLLLLSRRTAVKLFGVTLLISIISFVLVPKWGISFLPPFVAIIAFGYSYLIDRYGYLR